MAEICILRWVCDKVKRIKILLTRHEVVEIEPFIDKRKENLMVWSMLACNKKNKCISWEE